MQGRVSRRAGVAVLFLAPVVFLAGAVAHPFVRSYLEIGTVAEAAMGAPFRWAAAHLTYVIGIALILLASVVISDRLQDAGEERWSRRARTFLIAGGVLLAALVGSEITLSAVVTNGGGVLRVLERAEATSLPLISIGSLFFVLGWLSFGVSLRRASFLPQMMTRLAMVALALISIGFLIPTTASGYVYGAGLLVLNWLIGYRMIAAAPGVASVTGAAVERD
jgi:hypothetical protein